MSEPTTAERLYRESQHAICELITPENEHTTVPACPAWTLHDLLAHVTGALEDFLSRNTDGAPGEAWTAAHVERYRSTNLAAIQANWLAATDKAGPLFRHMGVMFLPDIVTHEFDVRGALVNRERRDAEGLSVILNVMQQWKRPYFEEHQIPPFELMVGDRTVLFGEGDPQSTLTTSLFEAARAIGGRRSLHQIGQMNWSADPEKWLPHLSVLGIPEQDLVE